MMTAAVVCDGNVECHESVDESWSCDNITHFTWYGVPACFVMLVAIAAVYKHYTEAEEEKTIKASEGAKQEEMNINMQLLKTFFETDKETRIRANCEFFQSELVRNNNNLAQTICGIKSTLHPAIFKVVYEDCFPGMMRRYLPCLEDFMQKLGNYKKRRFLLHHQILNIFQVE